MHTTTQMLIMNKRCGWENLISIFLMNNLNLDTFHTKKKEKKTNIERLAWIMKIKEHLRPQNCKDNKMSERKNQAKKN